MSFPPRRSESGEDDFPGYWEPISLFSHVPHSNDRQPDHKERLYNNDNNPTSLHPQSPGTSFARLEIPKQSHAVYHIPAQATVQTPRPQGVYPDLGNISQPLPFEQITDSNMFTPLELFLQCSTQPNSNRSIPAGETPRSTSAPGTQRMRTPLSPLHAVQNRSFECKWRGCKSSRPFRRETDLIRHLRTIHISPAAFVCPEGSCGKPFGRRDHLMEHLKRRHRS
ncbi:hypothetical protein BJY01DRAFT_223687 [Aspergillus pseudoustus]|uniref:C2H2-type domain-containing protein n=1 Tax=Aspergillus pseudoustus TaxID=1810923 RepID=A0ABR4J5U0_9EURO